MGGKASRGRVPYSPSPNLSAMSLVSAAIACTASGPSASISTVLRWPAASIITPMMLFAFTRLPLREIQISHWKPPARCVSLAAARACSPSLLTISTFALGIAAAVAVHVHHPFRAPGKGTLHGGRERSVAARKHAQQHRQRGARHPLDAAVLEQARNYIAGRGAEDVGQHEDPVARIEAFKQLARTQHQVVGVVLAPDDELGYLLRRDAHDLAVSGQHRLADASVGDDHDADHATFFSRASKNMP